MKFRIDLKDPDGFYNSVADAAKNQVNAITGISKQEQESLVESRKEMLFIVLEKWVTYNEYITLEVDTVTKTIRVCNASETIA